LLNTMHKTSRIHNFLIPISKTSVLKNLSHVHDEFTINAEENPQENPQERIQAIYYGSREEITNMLATIRKRHMSQDNDEDGSWIAGVALISVATIQAYLCDPKIIKLMWRNKSIAPSKNY